MTATVEGTPVLVVGGGLVGLTAALFLQHHRTPFILIERAVEPSPLPRARGWAVRSMELFRQLGLQAAIEHAADRAWEQGAFGGGRRGATMLSSEELHIPDKAVLTGDDPSPCRMVACPQTAIEPILREALAERGGDARYGVELTALTQDADGVTAIVTDKGAERTIRAAWVIASDGSRGPVRRALGIDRHGSGAARHYLNIFFEADLAEAVRGRTFSQCEVKNDRVEGIFLSMNNTTKWSFHLLYDPDRDDAEGWPDEKVAELLHAAIGSDVALTIRHRGTWVAADRVADRYRDGRIFLAGDAAHIMPPWGGLNGNTGIADAHNLAWRLAQAVAGDPAVLDGYETDRRPVAVRNGGQAQLRTDFALRFGIETPENADDFAKLADGGALLMRYRYGPGDTVDALTAQEGTRFPHAWIERHGERRSTLDLFGAGETVLGGPDARADGVLRAGVDFRFDDDGADWASLTGGGVDTAIRIRPDGFVADRQESAVSGA